MDPSTGSGFDQQRGRGYGSRGRGVGNRGRGRGRGQGRGGSDFRSPDGQSQGTGMATVPAFRDVTPGVGVSIVLKVDQPTGRQVQGIVGHVLTSGNHPRGIKVRLQDGRVGRVQQIVDAATAQNASEGLSNLGRNGEPIGLGVITQPTYQATFTPSRRQYSDVREDGFDYDNEASSRAAPSLLDFVKQPKQKKKGKSIIPAAETAITTTTDANPPLAVCPVCGLFEGDEAAVAHHANSHFD
ncbi:hypothetical protein BLS_008010 [Venturia inaequalis]|uniref:Uncharacterized protein n=1 Tax=Venturia inaequalis TaxID=5025 RepID=A0A8H3VC18_VENIN|nr:hypothetical protein BLS_008010 [Venturia inaequalis]KAE9974575.1 hypothetical protein EG328_003748 [Venturia inaequalis]KAE9984981.1 hypothetical protein EG327_004854 [Venturia inaequalis]RDI80593.1 hypothetical protein Vi05172_g9421 [Venturia inaequalis]